MLPGRKTKVQNLRTGSLEAPINVDGNIADRITDFTWVPFSDQNRRRTAIANQTMHQIGLAATSDLSRI